MCSANETCVVWIKRVSKSQTFRRSKGHLAPLNWRDEGSCPADFFLRIDSRIFGKIRRWRERGYDRDVIGYNRYGSIV